MQSVLKEQRDVSNLGISYEGAVNEKVGMAMGGLGTGTIEIDRAGRFRDIRVQNNWHHKFRHPVLWGDDNYDKNANFLSVSTDDGKRRVGRLLQLTSPAPLPCVEGLTYTGEFPFTRIDYEDGELPCEVSLEAFSPFVPHDAEASSYPLVFFEIRLKNPGKEKVTATAAFSWQNDVAAEPFTRGMRPQGNFNELLDGVHTGVKMQTLRSAVKGSEYLLCGLPSDGVEYRAVADWWNLRDVLCEPDFDAGRHGEDFKLVYDEAGSLADWRTFLTSGELPPRRTEYDGLGQHSYHCPVAAVSGRVTLEPGQAKCVRFALCWFFPHHYDEHTREFIGHIYATRFPGGTADIIEDAGGRHDLLRERSLSWQPMIAEMSLPENLKQQILNVLYLFPRLTWWTQDGRFIFYEAIACVKMLSVCLATYVAPAMAAFFPDLFARALLNLRDVQLPSGEIPTTLGHRASIHNPEFRLCSIADVPCFALAVYIAILYGCGDDNFADTIYPVMKRALQWGITLDHDGDGVPDCIGVNQGWDTWEMKGAAAYVSDLWLAALFSARELADKRGDAGFAAWCKARSSRISGTVENTLWNGDYYDLCRTPDGRGCSTCFLKTFEGSGETGPMVDMPPLHPRERIEKTFDAIWRLNVAPAKHCAITGATANRVGDKSSKQSNSFCPAAIWPMCAAAMRNGKYDEATELAEECADIVLHNVQEPWLAQLFFSADTGAWTYGYHYVDLLSVWHLVFAVTGVSVNVSEKRLTLAPPRIPARGPIFTKLFFGQIEFAEDRKGVTLTFANAKGTPAILKELKVRLPADAGGRDAVLMGKTVPAEKDGSTFMFPDVTIPAAGLRIEWKQA